jgi:cold shock CspA family protein
MKGTIKFVDPKSRLWGFIIPEDNGLDVHFQTKVFTGVQPTPADNGAEVEFEMVEDDQGRHARSARFLSPPVAQPTRSVYGFRNALTDWAYLPFFAFRARDGKDYSSVLELLATRALQERWFYGQSPNPHNPYPVLDNYLKYTFLKLKRTGRVIEKGNVATFNTGLVDELYDPIYALFDRNPQKGCAPWAFYDFCVPGKGPSGRKLTSMFDPLPEPPIYFSSNFDMLLETTKDIHVDYEHVIHDGIRRDRFPVDFVRQHIPRGFTWEDPRALGAEERKDFLAKFVEALKNDVQCIRGIKGRLEDAKGLAEKRTRWNFKTAIPQYYPKFDTMSLLLPLSLMDDNVVDVALVVTRNASGSYQGRTVLPLSWAYKNARLVCRPDSDWLLPVAIREEDDRPEPEADAAPEDATGD